MVVNVVSISNALRLLMALYAVILLGACSGGSSSASSSSGSAATGPDPIAPEPAPGKGPSVSFSAEDDVVDNGSQTTLTWSARNVDSCVADGGWSGAKAVQGSEATPALVQATTFTLTCSGPEGSAMSMLSVAVLGTVTLSWQAPAENVDGSPLTDLAGYRIYYGETSRSYSESVDITDPRTTSYSVALKSGTYYFAMTALDAEGNESAYSNEVIKTVN